MLGRRGKDDEVGERPEERQPIRLVHEQLFGITEHGATPEHRLKFPTKLEFLGGCERGHGDGIIPLQNLGHDPQVVHEPAHLAAARLLVGGTEQR